MRRRTTPNSLMSSPSSPLYSLGSGMSLVVRAVLVVMPKDWRAKLTSASRWADWEARASSAPLRAQCWMKVAAMRRAQSSETQPGDRGAWSVERDRKERRTSVRSSRNWVLSSSRDFTVAGRDLTSAQPPRMSVRMVWISVSC